jgi:hypothetical protein
MSEDPHTIDACDAASGRPAGDQPAVGQQLDPGVPGPLRRERAAWYRQQFLDQYQPSGPAELAICHDLAWHAAAVEVSAVSVDAIRRHAVRGLAPFSDGLEDPGVVEDSLLAAAALPPTLDRTERNGLGHSKSLYRALEKLEQLQDARRRKAGQVPEPQFFSEADCEAHLVERFRTGRQRCSHCGGRATHYVAARRCLHCTQCKRQVGLRSGTVMANSPIPLLTWFEAIRWLLWRPSMTAEELSEKISVKRPGTVRGILKKIRSAMAERNSSTMLAGLDAIYSGGGKRSPESSVHPPRTQTPTR